MEQFEVVLKLSSENNPAFLSREYSVCIVGDDFRIRAGYTSGIETAIAMALRAINIRQAFVNLPEVTENQLVIKISA